MPRRSRLLPIVAASLLLWATTVAASGEPAVGWVEGGDEPSGVGMVADLLVARPLGLVVTVVGSVFFVLGLPFAAMAGDIDTPGQLLVVEPARYTFARPLGQISGEDRDTAAPELETWEQPAPQ